MKDPITVPVLLGFDHLKIVGELKIRPEALPGTEKFHFDIGYRVLKMHQGPGGEVVIDEFELVCVGLVPDLSYAKESIAGPLHLSLAEADWSDQHGRRSRSPKE